MSKQIRALMIGAHPDDCDFRSGGIALKYAEAGHKVKYISLVDGGGGHHILSRKKTADRRRKETALVAEFAGIEYDVWDIADCELVADLETRKRIVREIRKFNPDIIFCHRTNDYHTDHRNAAQLVQDASYLLIVPNFCEDTPAMKKTPPILHYYDGFQNPPFSADVVIGIDDVIDRKIEMLALQESQMFEWLPFTCGIVDSVPEHKEERLEWLHGKRVPRTGKKLSLSELQTETLFNQTEYSNAVPAEKYREKLIERYGSEKGNKIRFAEAFAVCEYGASLNEAQSKILLPF